MKKLWWVNEPLERTAMLNALVLFLRKYEKVKYISDDGWEYFCEQLWAEREGLA